MSVASEFPPVVHIPDRARRSQPEMAQPGVQSRPRHLALVGVPSAGRPAVSQAGAARTAAYAAPARLRVPAFAEGRLDRPTLNRPTLNRPAVGAGALRLTRRGVAVLVLGTILLAMLMLTVAHLSAGTSAAAGRAAATGASSVTVQPGDTLWSIAQRVQPDRDPRAVVDQLREVNHLDAVALVPGQTLKLG